MKYFIGLTLLALVAVTLAEPPAEQKSNMARVYEECIKQENVPAEDVKKIKSKDFTNPSQAAKCFTSCILEKFGALKDGAIQEGSIIQYFNSLAGEANAKTILTKCAGIKGADKCDTAFKLNECFVNTLKSLPK